MKTFKYLYIIVLIFGVILISSCGTNSPTTVGTSNIITNKPMANSPTVSAYQDTTHGNTLTKMAIDLLLSPNNPGNLTDKQRKLLSDNRTYIQSGAIEEDNPWSRTPNHFWDPEFSRYLTDDGFGKESTMGVSIFGAPPGRWAINWVQSGTFGNPNDFSYDKGKVLFVKAIPLYDPTLSSSKDVTDSMAILGHIVHVFQDMTSVPHTRNDAHPPWNGSGYESLCKSYTPNPQYITITGNVTNDVQLWAEFRTLAEYTHYNFFSEDSIPVTGQASWRLFASPSLPQTGEGYITGQGRNINPLVKAVYNKKSQTTDYSVDDIVHTSYANILEPKVIAATADVIKYFLSLKGDGTITIDNPADNTTVYLPSADISGHLTYYAASAAVYYRLASSTDLSRTKMVVPVVFANGKYTFTATVPLELGANTIDVEAYNENVNYTSARITVTYKKKPNDPPKPPNNPPGGLPPTSPPGSKPAIISPAVQNLLNNNPNAAPCILSNSTINPNANGPLKPFNQLCGTYYQYALFQVSYWIVYKDTGARMYVLDNGNPMYVPQFIGNPNSDPNRPSVWGLYNPSMNSFSNPAAWSQLDQPTLIPRIVPCNDPCFQGMLLPDDIFTGNGLPSGDYSVNGSNWRKGADGSVTQI